MSTSKKRQILSNLRSYLNEDVVNVTAVVMNEFYKHPTQMDISSVVKATFTNDRIVRRNKSITAEYNKLVREEPYDDTSLDSDVNAFFRNFEMGSHNLPLSYNKAKGEDISVNIRLINRGYRYQWNEVSPIYLKISFKADNLESPHVWYMLYDTSRDDNIFEGEIKYKGFLETFDSQNYLVTFEMFEGEGDEKEYKKFEGLYTMEFTVTDNAL